MDARTRWRTLRGLEEAEHGLGRAPEPARAPLVRVPAAPHTGPDAPSAPPRRRARRQPPALQLRAAARLAALRLRVPHARDAGWHHEAPVDPARDFLLGPAALPQPAPRELVPDAYPGRSVTGRQQHFPHRAPQASIDRVAVGRALVEAGILEVRWRSISPPIWRPECPRIPGWAQRQERSQQRETQHQSQIGGLEN